MHCARLKHCLMRRGIDFTRGGSVVACRMRRSEVDVPRAARNRRLGSEARIGKTRANAEHPQEQHSCCPAMQLMAMSKHTAWTGSFRLELSQYTRWRT